MSLQQICQSFGIPCNDDDEIYFQELCENSQAGDDREESDFDDKLLHYQKFPWILIITISSFLVENGFIQFFPA